MTSDDGFSGGGDFSDSVESNFGGDSGMSGSDSIFESTGAGSLTDVSHNSWFSRVAGAFMGMIFGLILFVVAFPLILWNEGRAVHRAQDLDEGEKNSIAISVDQIDPQHDGKLVYASGTATTQESLRDPIFGVSASNALRLSRIVEMYQLKESEHSETKKNLGGSETTKKTYTYARVWSPSLINSAHFRQPQGHSNPDRMPYDSADQVPELIALGAFQIPTALKSSFQNAESLPVTSEDLASVPDDQRNKLRVENGAFYSGANPDHPAIGDARIRFQQVPSGPCGMIGIQSGNTFAPHITRGQRQLFELRTGETTKEHFFSQLKADNHMMTWVLRFVGLALLFFGLLLLFAPLSVLADVIPLLGSLVGFGTGMLALLIALPLWLMTIAIGWMAFRPLLGIALMVLASGLIYLLVRNVARTRNRRVRTPPPIPIPGN